MNTSQQIHTIRVSHQYKDRILVPWAAISGYGPELIKKGQTVTMADGVTAKIKTVQELHIASTECVSLIRELYDISSNVFLHAWYERIPDMSSMWFLDLQLKKSFKMEQQDVDTTGISDEDN